MITEPKFKKVGNRRSTKGRNVHYQAILVEEKQPNTKGIYPLGSNKFIKNIKHIQETTTKLKGAELMLKFHELKHRATKPSEKTLKRKQERTFGRVVWNNGTFIGSVRRDLK